MIASRQIAFGKAVGNKLPDGVVPIEYLESTRTQYINTGVTGSSATKVEITAYCTNSTSTMSLFGARSSPNNRPSFCIWQKTNNRSTKMRVDFNSSTEDSIIESPESSWSRTNKNTVLKDGRNNYVNGTAIQGNADMQFTLACPFYICTINTSNSPSGYYFVGRIFSCKIWDANSVLVRDLIPVRVSDVGYMYDKVSGQFFGNSGTGAFVLGADI